MKKLLSDGARLGAAVFVGVMLGAMIGSLLAPVGYAAAPATWTAPKTTWVSGEKVTAAAMNENGTNVSALGNGMTGSVSACATADTTVNNSTVLTNVTGVAVGINASEKYAFLAIVHATSGTVPDFDFAMNGPAGFTTLRYGVTGQAPIVSGDATAYNARVSIGGMGFDALYLVSGYVVNGTTAGNLNLRFSQNVANATNSTVYTGTCVLVWRVA